MRQASMQRCQSLTRVMLLQVEGEQARKKKQQQQGAPAKKAPSPLQSAFGLRGRVKGDGADGAAAAAAPGAVPIRTPFSVNSPFDAAGGSKAKAAAAAAAVSSSSSDDDDDDVGAAAAGKRASTDRRVGFAADTPEDQNDKPIATLFSGGGPSGEWRQLLAARRRAALHANAKKLRRWTSSLRVVRKPNHGRTEGVDAGVEDGATAVDEEEGEAVPWEHLWVHALGGGLSLLAFAAGAARVLLGVLALLRKAPASAASSSPSSSSSFSSSWKAAPAAPAAAAPAPLPAPQALVFTAWAFANSVPPALLFVRALRGDGPTLKRWCAVAPRAVFAVAGLALAGVLAGSSSSSS
jgi:hypothetical protein